MPRSNLHLAVGIVGEKFKRDYGIVRALYWYTLLVVMYCDCNLCFWWLLLHIPCWCCPYIKPIAKFIAHRFLLNWGGSRGYCTFSLITLPLPQSPSFFNAIFVSFRNIFCWTIWAPIGFGQLSTLLVMCTRRTVKGHWARYGQSKVGQRLVRRGAEVPLGDILDVSRMP